MYTRDNHNSVLGIRQLALNQGAAAQCVEMQPQASGRCFYITADVIELFCYTQNGAQSRIYIVGLVHREWEGGKRRGGDTGSCMPFDCAAVCSCAGCAVFCQHCLGM